MNRERPFEDHVPGDGDDLPYEWLDEWLCEYVDGTMDPSLEAVFEQYVNANPELKAHVKRLRETRDLLCNCGLPEERSAEIETEVCTEVECDMLRSSAPLRTAVQNRPLAALGIVSSVTVALVVGFLVGATVMGPGPDAFTASSSSQPPVGSDVRNERSPSPPAQAPARDAAPLLYGPADIPFSGTDSTHRSSTVTTIGLP